MIELWRVVDEVRLSFHAFSEFARWAHGQRIDPPGRAVLEFLSKSAPATVPMIARARGVTRQHIQMIVNELEGRGLVTAVANPSHRRSSLIDLTVQGHELIAAVTQREHDLLAPLVAVLNPGQLTAAADTLAEIRKLLADLDQPS